jgi:hypothetical protein
MKDLASPLSLLLNLIIILLLGLIVWRQFDAGPPVDGDGYLAVALLSGAAYYGKPVRVDGEFLVLDDVHYVTQVQDPETKAVSTLLVKRGREPHGPQQMTVGLENVLFIEAVAPDSEIGRKIAEAGTATGQ